MGLAAGRFGPFILLDQLGRGGMGEVWLAQRGANDRELCVVKTMRADVAEDQDALRRFGDEARLALMLVHPRITRVLDAGRVGADRYIAIELVEGIDLFELQARLAQKAKGIDDGIALWIGACLLDALNFAHQACHPISRAPLGVVHRDVSPHNVMCDHTGQARMIDFGLALSSLKRAKTEQNIVMGKLTYMSPEQARGAPIDRRCDIFAAGVTIYEMLAHDRFYGDMENSEIWTHVGAPQYVPRMWTQLPVDLQRLLAPLLERDPNKRPSDAAAIRDSIGPLLHARGGAAAACKRLAALVAEAGGDELERVRKARASIAPAPASQPEAPFSPMQTESFAMGEAAAIAAAVASKTLELPAFTKLLESSGGSAVAGPVPAAPTVTPPPAPAAAAPGPGPEKRDTVMLRSIDVDSINSGKKAIPQPAAPPPRARPMTSPGARPRGATGSVALPPAARVNMVAIAGGAVAAVLVVTLATWAFWPSDDAPAVVDAGTPVSAAVVDAGASASEPVVEHAVLPPTLGARILALSSCEQKCARDLVKNRVADPDALPPRRRNALELKLLKCESRCGAR